MFLSILLPCSSIQVANRFKVYCVARRLICACEVFRKHGSQRATHSQSSDHSLGRKRIESECCITNGTPPICLTTEWLEVGRSSCGTARVICALVDHDMIVSLINNLRNMACVAVEDIEESVELAGYFRGRIPIVGMEDNDTFMLGKLGAVPPSCLRSLD